MMVLIIRITKTAPVAFDYDDDDDDDDDILVNCDKII